MSNFLDPLTRASAGSDCEEECFELPKDTEKSEIEKKEDDADIFDTEGKTKEQQQIEDEDIIDLVNDGSLAQIQKNAESNNKRPSDDNDSYVLDDQQDLFLSVEKPEKIVLAMETYISYQVSTKTTRSMFDDSEYKVQRRYQDFVWLRSKLEEDFPTHLIPPLPSKFIVKGMVDRFSSEFVDTRCRALDSFLKRLSEHPVISFSDHLKLFVSLEDFVVYRKRNKPGLLSRVGGTVKSVGSSMRSRGRDPEFAEMSDYVASYREQMAATDRVAERLLVEEKELVGDLTEYAPTYSSWAPMENHVLGPIMTSLSKCLVACAEAAQKNEQNHELYFIPPLKEYILYCDGIEQVFKRRDGMQSQRDKCFEELKRRKEEENLASRYEELSDDLEKANADLRSDLERWKHSKKQDMKQIFSQLADSHIRYQTRVTFYLH